MIKLTDDHLWPSLRVMIQKFRIALSHLVCALALVPLIAAPVVAEGANCLDLESKMRAARRAGDQTEVSALASRLLSGNTPCTALERELILRQAALAFYDQAIAPSLSDERRASLLRDGLRLAEPWKMSAMLGDLEMAQKGYLRAAELYRNALDDMRDTVVNPEAPSLEVQRAIFKKAEQAALLAPRHVAQVNMRSGKPGGIAGGDVRGFVPQKVAHPIQFVYREATFTEAGAQAVKEMLELLRETSPPQVTLTGHTDSRGDNAFNKALSIRRAKAVADYLRSNGYRGKIRVEGRGEDEPYVGDGSVELSEDEIHQQNRRVELEVPNDQAAQK